MAAASGVIPCEELRNLLEEKERFYSTELSQVSSLLDSWEETMQVARRQLENVQRQGQISCQQKAPGDIRPSILQGFTVNLVGVRRQAKMVNDLLHRTDRIQEGNEASDEVNEILKVAAQVNNNLDVDSLMDRVQKYCISRSQQCVSITQAYVQDFGRAAKMLFEDMQQHIAIVEDFMEKQSPVITASEFMKVNRGIFDRFKSMQNTSDENRAYLAALAQSGRKSTQVESDWDSSSSNNDAAGISTLASFPQNKSDKLNGNCDVNQQSSSKQMPPTTNAVKNIRTTDPKEHSDWDATSSDEPKDATHKAPILKKTIQQHVGQSNVDPRQSHKSCNNDRMVSNHTESTKKTAKTAATEPEQSAQFSDWDSNSSDEQQIVTPKAPILWKAIQRTVVQGKMGPKQCATSRNNDGIANDLSLKKQTSQSEPSHVRKQYANSCSGGGKTGDLKDHLNKAAQHHAVIKTPSGQSTQLSDWHSSSSSTSSAADEDNVASIAPISKKEITRSNSCLRKVNRKQSAQICSNGDLSTCLSERAKKFAKNFGDSQSKLNQSKHILDSDSSRSGEDEMALRNGTIPMKTTIQINLSNGKMKPKETTGNNSKSSVNTNEVMKQGSPSTPTEKTVKHQNISKPTARITSSKDVATPDLQTKYGRDGLSPNGMAWKEIKRVDELFCVEKNRREVHDLDGRIDARQRSHNDQASNRPAKTSDQRSTHKKNKNSKGSPEKETSASHNIIGRITSALGEHRPMDKRDDVDDSAGSHKRSGKKKEDGSAGKKTKKIEKDKKKTGSHNHTFYPDDYAPVSQACYSRDHPDEPDEYSTPITDHVTSDKRSHTRHSQLDTLTKGLDLTAARATNVRVVATRDYRATTPDEIGLRKGTVVKQKRAMNSQGMAFGWKKTRYGIKKHGYFPSAAVILYPTEENYGRLGLPFPPVPH